MGLAQDQAYFIYKKLFFIIKMNAVVIFKYSSNDNSIFDKFMLRDEVMTDLSNSS